MRTARAARLVSAALLVASCSRPDPPQHVLLVVLDATHAGQLSCYGGPAGLTPALDALAARGVRFDRAHSAAAWTLPSTASLLTGQVPERHGVVTDEQALPDEARTLPELLRDAGWSTAAFVQMVYASDSYALDQGFDDDIGAVESGLRRRRLDVVDHHSERAPLIHGLEIVFADFCGGHRLMLLFGE